MTMETDKLYHNRRVMMDSGFYKFEYVAEGDSRRTYFYTVYGCKTQKEAEERLSKDLPGSTIVELVQRVPPKAIKPKTKGKK
jgi:hypothetical protein